MVRASGPGTRSSAIGFSTQPTGLYLMGSVPQAGSDTPDLVVATRSVVSYPGGTGES